MSRLGKMPGWQRTFVIFGMMTCSLSGLVYLIGHQFHIQKPVLGTHGILAVHGITGLLATLALGSVMTFHLKAGYKSRRKWISGFSQLSFLAVLLISAALLYYGPEEMREATVDTHWITGLLFFTIFIWHGMINLHRKS